LQYVRRLGTGATQKLGWLDGFCNGLKVVIDKSMQEKENNTYLELCAEAYDLRRPKAPSDAYAFYRAYVKAAQGLILEPMCSSGSLSLKLCKYFLGCILH